MTKKQYVFIILTFFFLAYLLPLGNRPLLIPDESRYAEIPREMIASGDWVVPQLNGVKYFEKPIMGYWLLALSQKVLGESNFAVRFPGALATGVVALLISLLLTTVLGKQDSRVYLAPLIYLSSFGIYGIGTIAVLDTPLNMFLTASIALFFLASEKPRASRGERFLLLAAGISVGCAFMTKGFLALVVPLLAVIPYLIWQKRRADIIPMLIPPAIAAFAVSLPWTVMIHIKDPDFWNFFFWHEHIKRFFSDNAQHREPFYFYFLAAIPLFLPWIFLLPSALSALLNQRNHNEALARLTVLCTCWLIFPLLFFSVSRGKLLTYILPCLVPLVILTTLGLHCAIKRKKHRFDLGLAFFMLLCTLVLGGIIGSQIFSLDTSLVPELLQKYQSKTLQYSTEFWKPLLIMGSVTLMLFFCFLAMRIRNGEKKLVLIALSPLALMISACFALPDLTLTLKAPGLLLEKKGWDIPDGAMIVADSTTATAICWYLKRNDIYLLHTGGELNYGLLKEGGHRLLSYDDLRRLVKEKQDKDIVLVIKTELWELGMRDYIASRDFISSGNDSHTIVKY